MSKRQQYPAATAEVSDKEPALELPNPATLSAAIARFVGDALPPVATGLGLLYLLFAIAHYTLLPPPLKLIMTTVAAVTALFLFGIALYWRRNPLHLKYAHFSAALLGTSVLINSWLHLWLTGDPLQTTNLMLLIVGVGFFYLSSIWFTTFVCGVFVIWAGTFYFLHIPATESTHFGFGLISAILLSTLAHLSRKHTLTRLTRLRLRDAQHAQALQDALNTERESEAALRHSEAGYRQLSIRLEEQAEALRLANEELGRAATLKDEFLANMSHELRTPLTAILGLTESLREQIYGTMTERQLMAINNVHASGRHLLELINDILDVAKLEAGKLELELVPTDARMIAEASLRFFNEQIEKKGLTIQFEDDREVSTFLADERRIKQILVNLLSNAVKFTNEGGQIGLRLEGDVDNRIVRYVVRDTGIGISQEQMARLFQPFVQADSRLARRYAGSGLGLVLTHRMAEIHGGSITVTSRPDEGSTFTVALPWRKLTKVTQAQPAATVAPHGSYSSPPLPTREMPTNQRGGREDCVGTGITHPTVGAPRPALLIVDKQSASRAWLTELVATLPTANAYDVMPASSSADALRLIRELQPQLVFIDLKLGGNESINLLRTIASDADLAARSIVALSALNVGGEAAEAIAAGAHTYYSKPLGYKTLQGLLSNSAPAVTKK